MLPFSAELLIMGRRRGNWRQIYYKFCELCLEDKSGWSCLFFKEEEGWLGANSRTECGLIMLLLW